MQGSCGTRVASSTARSSPSGPWVRAFVRYPAQPALSIAVPVARASGAGAAVLGRAGARTPCRYRPRVPGAATQAGGRERHRRRALVREITSQRNQARRLRPTLRKTKRSAFRPRGDRASASTRAFVGKKRRRTKNMPPRCPIEWTPNERQVYPTPLSWGGCRIRSPPPQPRASSAADRSTLGGAPSRL